jgi:hypothetical protein
MCNRNNHINLVLWGSRETDFDAEGVHSIGQESPVLAIFVGTLLKSYKGDSSSYSELLSIQPFHRSLILFPHCNCR